MGKKDLAIGGDTYHNRFATDRKHNKGSKFKPLKKKCVKCGTSSGQLDINHKDGNRKNNNRSNLQYMCRSCHRKMHAKKNGGKGSVEIISTASRIISPGKGEEAIANSHQNSDLMYVEFILCHEGTNKNQDEFFSEDLKASASTAINKPINWEHKNINIGVIYESKFVSVNDLDEEAKASYEGFDPLEKDFVVCKACIWEYKHPREAGIMRQRHAQGSLFFSMENLFEMAKCSDCGEVYKDPYEYCDHLLSRQQTGKASRQFINSNFIASACVYNPADEGAVNLALAHIIGDEVSFASLVESTLFSSIDIKSTIIPYIVNTEGFDMTINKLKKIPEAYANSLELDDELFADEVNRLFPLDSEENVVASASLILNNDLDFYSDSEKLVVVERLAKALKENNLTIETYIEEVDKGGSAEMTIDKNSPEFIEAVNQAVASKMQEIESGAELEKLQGELATAKTDLEKAEEAKAKAEEAIAGVQKEFDEFKNQIESEKQANARLTRLDDEGIDYSDNKDFVAKMAATASDEDFDSFFKTLVDAKAKYMSDEQKKKEEEEKKKKAETKDAKASVDPVTESQDVAIASKTDDVATASKDEDVVDSCLKSLLDLK